MGNSATIKDVAAAAGVSVAAVSYVMNGKAAKNGIAPATQQRVLAAARQLGYKPNVVAREMAMGKLPSAEEKEDHRLQTIDFRPLTEAADQLSSLGPVLSVAGYRLVPVATVEDLKQLPVEGLVGVVYKRPSTPDLRPQTLQEDIPDGTTGRAGFIPATDIAGILPVADPPSADNPARPVEKTIPVTDQVQGLGAEDREQGMAPVDSTEPEPISEPPVVSPTVVAEPVIATEDADLQASADSEVRPEATPDEQVNPLTELRASNPEPITNNPADGGTSDGTTGRAGLIPATDMAGILPVADPPSAETPVLPVETLVETEAVEPEPAVDTSATQQPDVVAPATEGWPTSMDPVAGPDGTGNLTTLQPDNSATETPPAAPASDAGGKTTAGREGWPTPDQGGAINLATQQPSDPTTELPAPSSLEPITNNPADGGTSDGTTGRAGLIPATDMAGINPALPVETPIPVTDQVQSLAAGDREQGMAPVDSTEPESRSEPPVVSPTVVSEPVAPPSPIITAEPVLMATPIIEPVSLTTPVQTPSVVIPVSEQTSVMAAVALEVPEAEVIAQQPLGADPDSGNPDKPLTDQAAASVTLSA